MLVFPECFSDRLAFHWLFALLVVFTMFIFQDLIGDDFQLAFHSLCLVYLFSSCHWSEMNNSEILPLK